MNYRTDILYLTKWTLVHTPVSVQCLICNVFGALKLWWVSCYFILFFAIDLHHQLISNNMMEYELVLCFPVANSSLHYVDYIFLMIPRVVLVWSISILFVSQRMPFNITNNSFAWQDRVLSNEVLLWRQDLILWEN